MGEVGVVGGAFAARAGIDEQRLYWWRRRLDGERQAGPVAASGPGKAGHRAAESTPEFLELRAHRSEPIEIVLRSGRALRVPATIEPSVLERLVAALERTEC